MNSQKAIHTQTIYPVLDDLGLVETHHKLLAENICWTQVGTFIDEDVGKQKSVLIVLLEEERIIAVFRVCLQTPKCTLEAVRLFTNKSSSMIFRAWQGQFFTSEDIQCLSKLNDLWEKAKSQSVVLSYSEQLTIYEKIFSDACEKGRGKDFSTATKRKVIMDAHGRCMFRGCGADLEIDELTGVSGNFGYLAHNVASSESGPRGIPGVSQKISDDPLNILLLCDKHHRLIDKVAAVDYPAHELSNMRTEFCCTVSRLLNALAYDPVPAIAVLWPVQRATISAPSNLQINQSLAKNKWRASSDLLVPSGDNDAIFRDNSPGEIRYLWPKIISNAAEKVISCIGYKQYRAGLFAFGPMPQLIALGAKIGNKQEVIPMLRYRDGNQWIWPDDTPRGICYDINGMGLLGKNEEEIILALSFTNSPPQFKLVEEDKGLKKIEVLAKCEVMGNGAIGHPLDGLAFMADMQRLLHELKSLHGVKKIHLLPCASNAVCVFMGKAFDIHHPELIVYDFAKMTMLPILRIKNKNSQCSIELVE